MIVHRATLDVPRELAWFVARLLLAERRRRGTPRGSRALTCFWQAVLGLRWFRDRTTADAVAHDHGILAVSIPNGPAVLRRIAMSGCVALRLALPDGVVALFVTGCQRSLEIRVGGLVYQVSTYRRPSHRWEVIPKISQARTARIFLEP